MNSLISPDSLWIIWAVVLGGTALSIFMEHRFRWAEKLSAPVVGILLAMALSNAGIMPTSSPVYDVVEKFLVPAAIPLLLLRANFLSIIRSTGQLFVAVHLAAIGTMIGAVVATWLLRSQIERIEDLAGIMAGSYVGGMVNFVALKSSLQVPDNMTSSLVVADNFVMAAFFLVLFMIAGSRFFLTYFRTHSHTPSKRDSADAENFKPQAISLRDIAKSLAIAFLIAAVAFEASQWIRGQISNETWRPILGNFFLMITLVSVLVATLFPKTAGKIQGSDHIGIYFLYVFLFVIGFPADFRSVISQIPFLFLFCFIIAISNLLFTLIVGRLFGLRLEDLLLSINATLGGPPTAAAMAVSKGWHSLILPGLLIGLWGYIIGTPVGLFVTYFLKTYL